MNPTSGFEIISRAFTGCWTTAAVGSAVSFSIFSLVEEGTATVEGIAETTGIPMRQARALLEALKGLKLLEYSSGRFKNSDVARTYLLPTGALYLGDLVKISMELMPQWSRFDEAVATGKSLLDIREADHPYWPRLLRATVPLASIAAEFAARNVELPRDTPTSILDVGGGAGVFSATFLQAYPRARATQIDWRTVNDVARDYVTDRGYIDRFHTIDGDFRKVTYDEGAYDLIVYAQMAHGFEPEDNITAFRRFRSALKPEGTLLISDYIPTAELGGDAFGLLFNVNILLHTPIGLCWNEPEYNAWLTEAGFRDIRVKHANEVPTLIAAK